MDQITFQDNEINALRDQLKIRESDIAYLRNLLYLCFNHDGTARDIDEALRAEIVNVLEFVRTQNVR